VPSPDHQIVPTLIEEELKKKVVEEEGLDN